MSLLTEEEYRAQAIAVRPGLVQGAARLEAPCNIWNTSLSGECEIGAFTYFNYQCETSSSTVGRYCSIGQQVIINPGDHPIEFLTTSPIASDPSGISAGMAGWAEYEAVMCTAVSRPRPLQPRVTVGHDVWVGARAIITSGVTIGHGAVIGANSVVRSDVPDFAIVVGAPARVVRLRFEQPIVDRLLASEWWNYDLSELEVRDYSDVPAFLDRLDAALQSGSIQPFHPRLVTLSGS